MAALGFSVMEMSLVRIETQHHTRGGKVQELFLGDIHTDWAQRTQHRPTGYQQPLQNAMVRLISITGDCNGVQCSDQIKFYKIPVKGEVDH